MATACEMAGAEIPKKNDSISFIPTLKNDRKNQKLHKYLYWEFYERTFRQAVIMKEWKLIRSGMDNQSLELYDLSKDIHEDENLVKLHPAIVQRMISHMEEAHEPHPNWPTPMQKK